MSPSNYLTSTSWAMHVCVCLHTHVCVSARVPAHVGTRVCICVHIHVHTAAHVCCVHMWCTAICTCVCMCLCVCVCTCAFMSACLSVYTCLYVFLHMYVCMHVCVCMRVHVCTHGCMCVHVCACTECAPPSPHAEMTPPPPSCQLPLLSPRGPTPSHSCLRTTALSPQCCLLRLGPGPTCSCVAGCSPWFWSLAGAWRADGRPLPGTVTGPGPGGL